MLFLGLPLAKFWSFLISRAARYGMLAHFILTQTLLHPVMSKKPIHHPWTRLRELWLQSGRKCTAVVGLHFVIFTCFIPKDMLSALVFCLYFLQKFHFLHGGTSEARSLINSQSCFFFLSLFSLYDKIPVEKTKPKTFIYGLSSIVHTLRSK